MPAFMLRFEQAGFAPLTLTDNDPNDGDSSAGQVVFIGEYGTFNFNVTAGGSKPAAGTPDQASFDLSTFNMSSTSGGTLQITLADTDFTFPTGDPLTMTSVIGGRLSAPGASSVTFQGWANPNNLSPLSGPVTTIPAGSVTAGAQGPFGSGSYTSTVTSTFNRGTNPYSLFSQGTIVLDGPGSLGFNGILTVTGQPVQPEARITIAPDATNEVGGPHTFTATVEQDDQLPANAPGGDAYDGFGPVANANTTIYLANVNGATASPLTFTGTTDANGHITLTTNSPTAGQVVANATTTVVVNGVSLTRDTDPATAGIGSGPGGSGPATKTYVDAKILITPDATNEVGAPHTFTVTVLENAGNGAGFVPAAGETVTVTLTNVNGASTPTTTFIGTTNAAGQFQVTFASVTAGQVIGNSTANISVGGLTLTRDTDPSTANIGAGPGGSGPATKKFVDAKILITPNATNEVGQPHTFTVTVLENAGDGAGFVPASGESVTVNLVNVNGATASPLSFTGTTNASGQFLVTTNSSTAGQIVANATASVVVGGLTLTRDTDPATANIGAGPGGSGPATKTYVDAKILITPDATNEVGQPHTFTITVLENAGNGAGFVPAAGESVTVTLTNVNGASTPTTTFIGTTNASGQFQVTFSSVTAGQVIGNATATIAVGGLTLTRDTDPTTTTVAGPGGSGPATKKFVDAKITITPSATNEVGAPHTFTVTVLENAGDGAGFVAAAGEAVTVALANVNGASASPLSFTGTTNAAGQFVVTINSPTAGQVVANASATIAVGGLSLVRDTDPATANIGAGPGGSGPATKTYVDAKILITPDAVNAVGDPHTFTVTVLENAGDGAGLVPAAGESVTVTLTNVNGASTPTTTFTGTTNASGQFQVTFASATAGQVIGNATATIAVGGLSLVRDTDPATANIGNGGGSGPATKRFVDAKIILNPPTATNLINQPHVITATVLQDDGLTAAQGGDGVTGFAPAPNGTVVNFSLVNANGATASFVGGSSAVVSGGTASVTINSATAGLVTINGTTMFSVGGVSLTRDTDPATGPVAGPGGSGPVTKTYIKPGIDIEKTTNGPTNSNPMAPDYDNEDATNGPGVPILTPGSTVTWTYKVTNTGQLPYQFNEVVVIDDNGTPGNTADDMSTTNGQITFLSVQTGDADNILEPGEVWLYQASGIVQALSTPAGPPISFDMSGNSATTGSTGNIRTFTASGVSVNASAFSRTSGGTWNTAYLGSYGGGLGVTDGSEDGGAPNHAVDNSGRNNYVLLEFSESIILDSAFLGYVSGDSDLTVWIGTIPNAFNSHQTLSDALLASLGFTEVNLGAGSTRTADLNAGLLAGNVIVIAAKSDESNDYFKIDTLTVSKPQQGIYENKATVTAPNTPSDSDLSHYKTPTSPPPAPGIDIEKTTNGPTNSNPTAPDYDNEDATNGPGVPVLTAGSTVTWTYKVTNTGNVPFAKSAVVVTDDNGTPGNTADDMSTTNGQITYLSGDNGDNILSPGEVWLYQASGTVQALTTSSGVSATFDFSGNSSTTGSAGNIRAFTAGGVSVNASAFSRTSGGTWNTAYLGSYGGGLGVTDGSEDGGAPNHAVDNSGRNNYILLEFSENVILDSAFLGYISGDSDLTVWIGTIPGAFNSHQTLSDALLAGLGFTEVNTSTLTSGTRTADLNAGLLAGNVIVIAAKTDETNDYFKVDTLTVKKTQGGIYENKATVTVPGDSDSDLSHYKNSAGGKISGHKYLDVSGNGLNLTGSTNSPADTPLQGVTIYLDLDNDGVKDANEPTDVTDAAGYYEFSGLSGGTYYIREVLEDGFIRTGPTNADYIKVNLATNGTSTNNDFANAEKCEADTIYNVSYKIVHTDGTSEVVTDLRGNTQEGDVVTVTFYVNADEGSHVVTLVSYMAPAPYFDANTASQQEIYDIATGTFNNGGPYTLTVTIPNCYYQVDFVCGYAIDQLGPNGSNIFYTPQERLESADNGGTHACCDNEGSISGVKFKDSNGNGVKDSGEVGLANWVIYIDANNNGVKDSGELATVTKSDGSYKINNLAAGTYKIKEVQQAGWVATLTPGAVTLAAGQDKTGVNFGNKPASPGSISGYKFNDKNADGEWDKNGLDNCTGTADDELGMSGWTIFVDYDGDGVKDANEPSDVTDSNGYYKIDNVAAGTWDVVEVVQSSWVRTTDDRVVTLTAGEAETNVLFGNFCGNLVMEGDTATVGFWKGTNGKTLIYKLNGGGTSGSATALGNWLGDNFGEMYGYGCGSNDLRGKTNAQIYTYFCSLVTAGKNLEAQVLATVLAVYATDSDWAGGTYAAAYGFTVTTTGVKNDYYNIGTNGAAFGVVDDSALTVWDILQRTNARASNGVLWSGYSSTVKSMAATVYTGINASGGIV